MNRKIITGCAIVAACTALAMPTKKELNAARELVADVIGPDLRAYKAGEKSAADFAEAQRALAAKTADEAQRYLLLQSAFKVYAHAEEYEKAADVLAQIRRDIPDVPPNVVVEVVSKAMGRVAGKRAPRMFRMFKCAKTQVRSGRELAEIEKDLKARPRDMKLNERLGVCKATLGDWPAACEAFLKAGGAVAKTVRAERGAKPDWAAIADFWWNYNRPEDDDDRRDPTPFQLHAADFYCHAVAAKALTGMKLIRARQRIAFAYPGLAHRWSFSGNLNDGVGDRELKKQFDTHVKIGKDKCYLDRALLYSDNIDFNGPFTIELWTNHADNFWRGGQTFAIYDDNSRSRKRGLAYCWQVRGPFFGDVANGNSGPDKVTTIPFYKDVYIAATYDPANGNMVATRYLATRGTNVLVSCTNTLKNPFAPHTGLALGCEWNFPCWGWYGRSELSIAAYDEVRVWNRALTPEEIRASMQSGPGALPRMLSEEWTMPVVDRPFRGNNPAFVAGQKAGTVNRLQLTESVGIDFAYCPEGSFKMGYSDTPTIAPLRDVTITRPFWISKSLLTARQVAAILKECAGPSDFEFPFENRDQRKQMTLMMKTLQVRFGNLLPKGYEFRLPTEAEYEYVAKAGSKAVVKSVEKVWYHGIEHHPWGVEQLEKSATQMAFADMLKAKGDGLFTYVYYPNGALRDPIANCTDGCGLVRWPAAIAEGRNKAQPLLELWGNGDETKARLMKVATYTQCNQFIFLVVAPIVDSLNKFTPQPPKTVPSEKQAKFDLKQKPLTAHKLALTEDIGMDFQFCPAGTFKMGYVDAPAIAPLRDITITRPFWITKGFVMGHQMAMVSGKDFGNGVLRPDTRQQVDEYVAQFQKKYGSLLPKGYVFRLPTEAEWEYVAKSGAKEAKGELFNWKHDYRKNPLKNEWDVAGMCEPSRHVMFDKIPWSDGKGAVKIDVPGNKAVMDKLDYSKASNRDPYAWSDDAQARTFRRNICCKEGEMNLKISCLNVKDSDSLWGATFHLVVAPDPATLNKFEMK